MRAVLCQVELDGAPDATPIYDGGTESGPYGFFAFLSVAPGTVELRVRHGEVLVTRIGVPVVADTVSYVWLWPATSE